jgi:hypothetical protein
MHLATLDRATPNPSLSSSPWMRGAPQSKFSVLICRISAQFNLDSRPPSSPPRFPAPTATKAGPVPTHLRLKLDNRYDLQDRRKTSIHLDEEPAVVICEPSPAFQLTSKDDQLMTENRILRLKPALRLERRGQHGQNKPNQRDHRANLADSVT